MEMDRDALELFAEEDIDPAVAAEQMTEWEEEEEEEEEEKEEEDEEEEEEDEEEKESLDATLPAVLLSRDERRRLKNKKKSQRRKEKTAERNRLNEQLLAAGLITRRELAEQKFRRCLEGIVARERGRLRQEADQEIERRLQKWREDVESGRIDINRRISIRKGEKRKAGQSEHQRRRRAERQATRRSLNYGWGSVGCAVVLGSAAELTQGFMDQENWLRTETPTEDLTYNEMPVATVTPRVADVIPLI